jgi:CubicO group peptidase (beta-lactamase class C family)
VNWQPVKSSQIGEVGFQEPSTLGIRFKPNKQQALAGQHGSEYHYANVSPEMHAALVEAVSIGQFFGEHIKKHPELYPYIKIEPEVK